MVAAKLDKSPEAFVTVGQLLPWFAWAMVPLILSNVLLNNLLARRDYRCVSSSIVIVAAYAAAAVTFGSSFVRVIQILGLSNLAFLAMLVWFNYRLPKPVLVPAGENCETASNARQTSPVQIR